MDAGFIPAFAPPREVLNLRFTGKDDLAWNHERSIGDYSLYRGLISALPGAYGACELSGLTLASATDPAAPPAGDGYFYLVTANNRLDEEGTKGFDTLAPTERANPVPCP